MTHEFECQKCGEMCMVDGDPPKFLAWCCECDDYAKGFDDSDYAADYYASRIDDAMDRRKERMLDEAMAADEEGR